MILKSKYRPLSHQRKFHVSRKQKVYLSSGYGGGKTHSLVQKLFNLVDINKGFPGGILCPDLKMFKRDVWPMVQEIAAEGFNRPIKVIYNRQDSELRFPEFNAKAMIFHSEDHGQSIRGPNLAWGLINEVTICTKGAFDALLSRIRLKKAPLRQLAMSGTPESFNWCYDYFIAEPREDTELIFGNSRENIHVADTYIKELEESYDDLLRQQYIEGKFISLTGKAAVYAFNRHEHVRSVEFRKDWSKWVSLDFNIYPMAAVLWQTNGRIIEAVREWAILGSDTEELCNVWHSEYGDESYNWTIYPDPAGSAGSTKAKHHRSDFDILREKGYKKLKYRGAIKSVRDCLNATNRKIDNGDVIIDPSCKNLIKDFEQCIIKDGTFEIDKSDPNRTHWLDGAKNMIEYEFPILIARPEYRQKRYR